MSETQTITLFDIEGDILGTATIPTDFISQRSCKIFTYGERTFVMQGNAPEAYETEPLEVEQIDL